MRKRSCKKDANRVTKLKAIKLHAKKRFNQRTNITFSKKVNKDLVRLIQNGKTECIEITSNTRTIHIVDYNGETLKIVYDKLRKTIVTVLPLC